MKHVNQTPTKDYPPLKRQTMKHMKLIRSVLSDDALTLLKSKHETNKCPASILSSTLVSTDCFSLNLIMLLCNFGWTETLTQILNASPGTHIVMSWYYSVRALQN